MKFPCTHTGYETAMSYDVEEALQDWVLSLLRSEIDSYLSRMELKRQGTLFRLLDRLSKWVLDIYEAFHVNSPSVAQNSALFGSCSN